MCTEIWRERRGEGALAEHLGEAALAAAARQLHLPQAVLRVQEAQRAERILHGLGEHVRHALAVAHTVAATALVAVYKSVGGTWPMR